MLQKKERQNGLLFLHFLGGGQNFKHNYFVIESKNKKKLEFSN